MSQGTVAALLRLTGTLFAVWPEVRGVRRYGGGFTGAKKHRTEEMVAELFGPSGNVFEWLAATWRTGNRRLWC